MKRLWIAIAGIMLSSTFAFAQVGVTTAPTPGIASPFGMTPGATVAPTGIPLGATELASPGISPAVTFTPGMTVDAGMMGFGTYLPDHSKCVVGNVQPEHVRRWGNRTGRLAAGQRGYLRHLEQWSFIDGCDAAGVAECIPAGIPLGSVEIGSAGVSPLILVPAPGGSPPAMGTFGVSPSAPMVLTSPPAPTMGSAGLSTNQTTMPCGSIVTSGPATFC